MKYDRELEKTYEILKSHKNEIFKKIEEAVNLNIKKI